MAQQSSKKNVFITHTEPACPGYQCNRATIACTLQDSKIVYGIAICADDDNFSRVYGRELAEERMKANYGVYDVKEDDFYTTGKTPEQAVALFALNLRRAVAKNYSRYKHKIHEFRIASGAKSTKRKSTTPTK